MPALVAEPIAKPVGAPPALVVSRTESPKDEPVPEDADKPSAPNGTLLEREWKVANDRVNWSLAAQAFLIVAFCVILAREGDRSGTHTTLLHIIPLIGLAINIAGLASLIAVQVTIQKLKGERSADQADPSAAGSVEGRLEKTRKLGFVMSLAIMTIFAAVWFSFLGSIPR